MSDIYLSDSEIRHITKKQKSKAQRKVLEAMGYTVKVRPDGSFWVPRPQFMPDSDSLTQKKKPKLNFGALKSGAAA